MGLSLECAIGNGVFDFRQIKLRVGIGFFRQRIFLVLAFDEILGFIGNHQSCSRFGDAQHFGNGTRFVGEEIDAADVKDDVKVIVGKGAVYNSAN